MKKLLKVIQTIDSIKYNYVETMIKEYYTRDEEINYNNHIDYINHNSTNIVYGAKHNDIKELFYIKDYYQNNNSKNSHKKYNNINRLYNDIKDF